MIALFIRNYLLMINKIMLIRDQEAKVKIEESGLIKIKVLALIKLIICNFKISLNYFEIIYLNILFFFSFFYI